MPKAIRQKTKIRTGGVLEIRSPEFPEGVDVEVIVLIDDGIQSPATLTKLIGSAKGCYASPEDADQFIRQERNQWD
ncbi:MAG: hypothetical protein AB1656_23680 [Candidatus Omnitrophota bacterium]